MGFSTGIFLHSRWVYNCLHSVLYSTEHLVVQYSRHGQSQFWFFLFFINLLMLSKIHRQTWATELFLVPNETTYWVDHCFLESDTQVDKLRSRISTERHIFSIPLIHSFTSNLTFIFILMRIILFSRSTSHN